MPDHDRHHHHHPKSGDPKGPDPQGHTSKVTVIRLDTGAPFIAVAQRVDNADGSVSFQLPDGSFAGQDPALYGARVDGENKQYQRATVSGSTVTFCPHPDYPAYVYLLGAGTVYPA
jgi:hypothetical protein